MGPHGSWWGGGVSTLDHGVLTGLADDDHPQYFLLAGRAPAQEAIFGTASAASATITATSHANAGSVIIKGNGTIEYGRFILSGASDGSLLIGRTTATSSARALEIEKTTVGAVQISLRNLDSGNGSLASFLITNDSTGFVSLFQTSTTYTGLAGVGGLLTNNTGGFIAGTSNATQFGIWVNNGQAAAILATGELVFGAAALLGTELALFARNQDSHTSIIVNNTQGGGSAVQARFVARTVGATAVLGGTSTAFTPSGGIGANEGYLQSTASLVITTSGTDAIRISPNATESARFPSGGGFLVGRTTFNYSGDIANFSKTQADNSYVVSINPSNAAGARAGFQALNDAGKLVFMAVDGSGHAAPNRGIVGCSTGAEFTIGTFDAQMMQFWVNAGPQGALLATGEWIFGATTLVGSETFSFQKSANTSIGAALVNATSGTLAKCSFSFTAGNQSGYIGATSQGFTLAGGIAAESFVVVASTGQLILETATSKGMYFFRSGAEFARFDPVEGYFGNAFTETIGAGVTDGFACGIKMDPGYSGAFTVTRHNYIDIQDVSAAASAVITDACTMRFDAAAGTHKALDAGTTKVTINGVDAWEKKNVNGTIHYTPMYLSKTA